MKSSIPLLAETFSILNFHDVYLLVGTSLLTLSLNKVSTITIQGGDLDGYGRLALPVLPVKCEPSVRMSWLKAINL